MLSTFCGHEGIYSRVYKECERSGFKQTGHFSDSALRSERVTSLSHELTAWLNGKFFLVVQ